MKSAWATKNLFNVFIGNCSCNRIYICLSLVLVKALCQIGLIVILQQNFARKKKKICFMTSELIHFLQLCCNNSNFSDQVPFSNPIPSIRICVSDSGIGPSTTITSPSRQLCQDFMPPIVMMWRHIHYALLFSKFIVSICYSFFREASNGIQWEVLCEQLKLPNLL